MAQAHAEADPVDKREIESLKKSYGQELQVVTVILISRVSIFRTARISN